MALRALVSRNEAGQDHLVEARNGIEGWQRFDCRRSDLVVSAMSLPGADGIDLLKRIRKVSTTPVILFSSDDDVRSAVTAIKAGAQEFLRYPGDLERLVDRASVLVRESADPARLQARIVGCSVAQLREQRERRQRDELIALLESCGGNIAEVARRLDLSRGAVTYRAQKYGLLPRTD